MSAVYTAEALGSENTTSCACCGRSVFEGEGWLLKGDDEVLFYRYRWADGHRTAFSVAIAATDEGGYMRPGYVAVSCMQKEGQLCFSVTEPYGSSWSDSEEFGPVLTRDLALSPQGVYPDLWQLVDALVEVEPRLAWRISRLQAT